MDMLAPWEPKILVDVCILSQIYKDYNIIKHINKDMTGMDIAYCAMI